MKALCLAAIVAVGCEHAASAPVRNGGGSSATGAGTLPPDPRKAAAELSDEAHALFRAEGDLLWKRWTTGAGPMPASALAEHPQLAQRDSIDLVTAAAAKAKGADADALRLLRQQIATLAVAREAGAEIDALERARAQLVFAAPGDARPEHGERDLDRLLTEEANAQKRAAIAQAEAHAAQPLAPLVIARDAAVLKAIATLRLGSWIEIEIQARTAAGRETRWWRMGVWAYSDATVRRTSINGQSDTDGVVETDTFKTRAEKMTAYRARVTLSRSTAAGASPIVRRFYAVVSDTRSYTPRYPSPRYTDRAMELTVPRYSQEIHAGELPQYDGGGEAWCSPTSTEMVVEYWNRRPVSDELSWVGPYADPQVDYAARFTYDVAYAGTGNWPFNTAYASHFGLSARVLQLGSLNDAERYIAAGIPLVASISHAPGALPGFLNNAGTNGHLLVIIGFTAAGDVVANDPAATSDATVRRVYGREAFERAWIGGSGGVVYLIAAADTLIP